MTTEELIAARRAEPWREALRKSKKNKERADIPPCEDERVGPGIPESYPFGGS